MRLEVHRVLPGEPVTRKDVGYLLPSQVVQDDLDRAGLIETVRDRCGRIERVRVVLVELHTGGEFVGFRRYGYFRRGLHTCRGSVSIPVLCSYLKLVFCPVREARDRVAAGVRSAGNASRDLSVEMYCRFPYTGKHSR